MNRKWSPFVFAVDNPSRYEDYDGDGPKDRIRAAKMLIAYGATYAAIPQDKNGIRTAYTEYGMQTMDCAEFVCRVMAADRITQGVQNKVLESFMSFVNDKSKFIHSNSATAGDIAVWYGKDAKGAMQFHTGIVTEVDKNGNYKLAHAAGVSKTPNIRENSNFTTSAIYDPGIEFQGFYFPVSETDDFKDLSITSDTKTSDKNANSTTKEGENNSDSSSSKPYGFGGKRLNPGDSGYSGSYWDAYDSVRNFGK